MRAAGGEVISVSGFEFRVRRTREILPSE
jgi:hypothetical protein